MVKTIGLIVAGAFALLAFAGGHVGSLDAVKELAVADAGLIVAVAFGE